MALPDTGKLMAEYRSGGKELRKSPKGVIAGALAVLLLGGVTYGAVHIWRGMENLRIEPSEQSSVQELTVPELTTVTTDPNQIVYGYEAVFADEVHSGSLVLVNRQTATEDIEEGLVSVYEKKSEHLSVKDVEVMLLEDAMNAFNAMADAFYAETGHEDLLIISGYRKKAYQEQLYQEDLEKNGTDSSTLVAKPGYSEHETGLAVDFNIFRDGAVSEFDGSGDYAWVTEHCAEYGLILRYPEQKTDVTGFDYEPWHFRYVGIPHALYMKENDLCLEEYMDLVERHPYEGAHLQMPDAAGKLCEVYFVPLDETSESTQEIPVPADLPYSISGNNRSGFIVTVETGRDYQPTATETQTGTENVEQTNAATEPSATEE